MRKSTFAAVILATVPLALTACSDAAEAPAAPADENAIAGVEVTDARLVLPPVSGNPGAVYFNLANNGERSVTFRNAKVASAARAEMHETVMQGDQMVMGEGHPFTVQPGESVEFAPGGRHVMAFDLGPEVTEGSTTEVTLIAAGGRRHVFEATVQAAGDDR